MTRLRSIALDGLLPAGLGVLASFGFAPFDVTIAAVAAVVGLILLWRRASPSRAAWRGFVFGATQFATGVSWVYVAMHAHGGMASWLAGLATGGLVIYLALYPALAGLIAGACRRLPSVLWTLLLVPAAWTAAEWLRSWLFTGFDWLALGYVATEIPVNGLAPVIGVHGLSFLLMLGAGLLVLLYTGGLLARAIACVAVMLTPVLLWCLPPAVHWTRPAGPSMQVAVIQGNVAQALKWRPEQLAPTIARYGAMTRQTPADLVVWPEVAIPAPVARVRDELSKISRAARDDGQTVLAGILRAGDAPDTFYNSIMVLGQGSGEYHKRHLVPFGEYVPGPGWLADWLDGLGAPIGRLAVGAETQPLIRRGDIAIGTSICFEDVFGRNIIRDLPRADLLVNVTNDGWFAGTFGPAQHLQIARMRAAEVGRPMVRAANTGISANIDFTGRVYARTAENVAARLIATVVPRTGTTPYARYGETPVATVSVTLVSMSLVLSGGLAWRRRRQDSVIERRRELMRRV